MQQMSLSTSSTRKFSIVYFLYNNIGVNILYTSPFINSHSFPNILKSVSMPKLYGIAAWTGLVRF